jgi:hypothetical protein
VHLPLLSADESGAIIDRALGPTGVTIAGDVRERIVHLAGGFPHPVHLVGSECFNADTDGHIDASDLDSALDSVVKEKWREQFDGSYARAGSGKSRSIIKAMARHGDEDVPSAWICEQLDVQQPEISSNINDLMKRDVIVRPDRGVYRFKEPLFRLYVRHLNVLGEEPVEVRPRKRSRPQVPPTG